MAPAARLRPPRSRGFPTCNSQEEQLLPLLELRAAAAAHRARAQRAALRPRHALRWLQPGRLCYIADEAEEEAGAD